MTPFDATTLGASWGAAVARAAFAGDATKQRRRRDEAIGKLPADLHGVWWRGHDAAYREAWWRLSGGEDVTPHAWYHRGLRRRRREGMAP